MAEKSRTRQSVKAALTLRFAQAFMVLFIMTAGTVLILETALWLLAMRNPEIVGLPAPECFVSEPGVEYRNRPDCGTDVFRINSAGFRGRIVPVSKKSGDFRIACIGDSYTASSTVDLEHSYPRQMEKILRGRFGGRVEVVNMGVPGYDTNLALQQYRKIGITYKPDLVVLGVFLGNDIFDAGREFTYGVYQGALTTWPPDRAERIRKKIALSSALYRVYRMRGSRVSRKGGTEDAPVIINGFPEGYLSYHLQTVAGLFSKKNLQTDPWRSRWDTTFRYLDELEKIVRDGGAEFMIVVMPDEMQVNGRLFDTLMEEGGLRREDYDLSLPDGIVMERCGEKGYNCVDLLPVFRYMPRDADFYGPGTGHWNNAGNLSAARRTAAYIGDKFLKQ